MACAVGTAGTAGKPGEPGKPVFGAAETAAVDDSSLAVDLA